VKKNRPVNLDISTIQLPITAYVSILHRASGVILFAGLAVLLWALENSLASAEQFNALKDSLNNPMCQFIIWATLAALAYHMVAGIRHLIMDLGIGESLEGGQNGAKIALFVAFIIIALLGAWIW
jgi:succinate dehydrogenase / fumarate reductase cytochrome b subunit